MIERRQFITGLVSFIAAPAIVRVSSIMPVKAIAPNLTIEQIIKRALAQTERDLITYTSDVFYYTNLEYDKLLIKKVNPYG